MSFIFGIFQYFSSSGSFAAQSLYSSCLCSYRHWQSLSPTIFMYHSALITCNISVKWEPDYVYFLVTILNSSKWNTHNKTINVLIQFVLKWFWSCGDRKSDHNQHNDRINCDAMLLKCSHEMWYSTTKIRFLILIFGLTFVSFCHKVFGIRDDV